jgi:hypothetical protein
VEKVKIESGLFDRAKRAATVAGYSSVEEFVAHCVEKEVKRLEGDAAEGQVADQPCAGWGTSNDGCPTHLVVWLNAIADAVGIPLPLPCCRGGYRPRWSAS